VGGWGGGGHQRSLWCKYMSHCLKPGVIRPSGWAEGCGLSICQTTTKKASLQSICKSGGSSHRFLPFLSTCILAVRQQQQPSPQPQPKAVHSPKPQNGCLKHNCCETLRTHGDEQAGAWLAVPARRSALGVASVGIPANKMKARSLQCTALPGRAAVEDMIRSEDWPQAAGFGCDIIRLRLPTISYRSALNGHF
jgi:hypothetical protein